VEHAASVERAVFMVQDEVARRLTASPGGKEWGALTVFVRAAFTARRVLRAPPGAFHPAPEVTSAVVELVALRPPRARETEAFRAVVRAAFEMRRKTLRNAWAALAPSAAALDDAAATAGVDLRARGETLDVESFARMAAALESRVKT
jgi:16S rRNA (adenine1518-N6/adenine1519-N6)-dimethyltransferase